MLVQLPNRTSRKERLNRIQKQPDRYIGHGYFRIYQSDIVEKQGVMTYVICFQNFKQNYRIFLFKYDSLVYTSIKETLGKATQYAEDYIWRYA